MKVDQLHHVCNGCYITLPHVVNEQNSTHLTLPVREAGVEIAEA